MSIEQAMSGRVCLVTGATAGIGKVTARVLAEQGATVIGVGRNANKCAAVVEEIKGKTHNPAVEYFVADLSSMEAVRNLARQFKSKYNHLHVLVNNVGAYFWSRQETVDGLELTFALNHLGVFLLTNLLLDTLKASVPSRIINVSSGAHMGARLNFDDLQNRKGFGFGWQAYGRSKLANILFTHELARRLEGTGVTVNALHPGFVASDFATNNGWLVKLARPLMDLGAISVEEGAKTTLYLATRPELANVTGKYFVEQKEVRSSQVSYDDEAARRLWTISEELAGLA